MIKSRIKIFLFIFLKLSPIKAILLTLQIINPFQRNLFYSFYSFTRKELPLFYQIVLLRQYDIKCQSAQVIIDCGANIGLSTIFFKVKYPNAKIISIEPDADNYNKLVHNIMKTHFDDIYPINKAIWYKEGLLSNINPEASKTAKIYRENNNSQGMKFVTSTTLSSIINDFKIKQIDILKIDIEGAEKYLFSYDQCDWLNKVKIVIIELHDRLEANCSKNFFNKINKIFNEYILEIRNDNIIIYNKDLYKDDE
ncbi:MAG: FkbM family methyltransferase [Ignavibacteriales bacterium]|nr:FkbM family methyltransferase [Ignavibacteriales bacterium]